MAPIGHWESLLRLINKAVMLKVVENASLFLGDMQWAVGVSDAGVILASIAQPCTTRCVPAEHRLEERTIRWASSDFEQSSRELPLTVSLVYDLLPPTDAAVAQRRHDRW